MKLTVLGKGMVGKSSITYRFINYQTPTDHDATLEDKYKVIQEIAGTSYEIGKIIIQLTCSLEIMDTAGQDDYQGMLDSWINFAEGFLLVFAINDKESFESLVKRRDRILKLKKGQNCPIVLVGNKCDLSNQRKVTEEEANEVARQWNAKYIETSAATNINCKECFVLLAKQIAKNFVNLNEVKTSKKKCCLFC